MRAHTHVYHTCARAALRQSITASSHANMCMYSQRQGAVYVYMRRTWHKERELEVDAFMKLRERRHQLHRVALLHAMEEEHALPRLLSASLRKPRCARLDGLGCVRSIETNGRPASHHHLTSTGPRCAVHAVQHDFWQRLGGSAIAAAIAENHIRVSPALLAPRASCILRISSAV